MKWWWFVVMLVGVAWADNNIEAEYSIFNCPELNSQEEIDLDKIMKKWYVVEVLEHKMDPMKPISRSYVVDSCPIVKLMSTEYGTLRLLWTEEAGNLEYTFRIPNTFRKPGFWLSTAPQNGSLVAKQYSQFSGSVHVMKAVASDMVLTFCSRQPDNQLYSLLLAREHVLQKSDKRGVHNLLARRGLKIVSIRETCMNSAGRTGSIGLVGWLALLGVSISTLYSNSCQ